MMLCSSPEMKNGDAIIIEFKVFNKRRGQSLDDTLNEALKQIEEKICGAIGKWSA